MSRTLRVAVPASDVSGRWSVLAPLLLGVAYYAGARLGFAFTLEPRPVSVLWLPNAILFAALLLSAPKRWWVLLGATLVAHMAAQIPADVPLRMAVCWFMSNSAEALIGATLVRRYSRVPFRLDRFANVVIFTGAALVAVFTSCFLDAAFVALNDWGSSGYWSVWRVRFFSNTLAALTVVPAIVGLSGVRLASLRDADSGRATEAVLLVALLLVTNAYAFGREWSEPEATAAVLYMPLPLLLWAAVRFGPGSAGAAVFITVLIATANAVEGRGPFLSATAESRALEIQLLFSTVAIAQIALAAVLAERQRGQAEVWRSREQLRLAVDAAEMTSWDWVVGDGGRATRRPELYRELETVLGRIHPSDQKTVSRAFRRALRSGMPLDLQFRVARPDGDVRWVHGLGRVLRDGPRRLRVVGLSADITDRKLAEALNRGESRILEMIATGASLRSILTSIVRLIESESLGLIGSILLLERDGMHVRHYAAPSLPESYIREIDGMAIGPNAGSCGTAMYLRQPVHSERIRDDPRWDRYRDVALRHGLQSCWSTPMFSDRAAVLGSFAIYYRYPRRPSPREQQLVEIGTQLAVIAIERRRAEFEASEQRRALAHLGRVAALGELSGTLAHELSQPLSVILSQAQAAARLLQTPPSPNVPELRSIIAEIVSAERRAARVIEHTRTMLVPRSPELAPLDLNQIVITTLDLMRGDLAAREVVVRTRLAAGLPPVRGDRVQLQQVLLNIMFNACDAMSASAPSNRVVIIVTRRTPDTDFVELAVTDYGTGIPADQIRHMFDQFYTSKEHGLGLGLSICRSIALAHGGRVYATNNPDSGATLLLQLPTSARADASDRARDRVDALASHADAR